MSLEPFPSAPRQRDLTAQAFERLLGILDADRDRAGAAYEHLRERVAGLLHWWGSPWPLDLADETMDRVARKLQEGVEVPRERLPAYVRGVARMVFYEAARRPREDELPETLDLTAPVGHEEKEESLRCLDRCLQTLSPADRDCVLRYYSNEESKTNVRRALAASLGVSATALRIRTSRLRGRLETCVSRCLESA